MIKYLSSRNATKDKTGYMRQQKIHVKNKAKICYELPENSLFLVTRILSVYIFFKTLELVCYDQNDFDP